jgi:glycosyltransferase involved in cell wall biosynthesis
LDNTFQPIAKNPDEFVFLRICRIGVAYNKSILDSFRLIETLTTKNINHVKLYVIGVVEDAEIYGKLKENPLVQNGQICFLTDVTFTKEASRMLYLGDAVIGTGRGLMESASLSKPLLTINAKGDIPVLLDRTNFLDAFETNFSERNLFPNYNHDENIKNIIKLIQNKNYYTEMSNFSTEVFNQYFNLDKVAEAYPYVYSKALTGKRNLLVDLPLFLRSSINFYRNYLKTIK